MRWSLSWPSDAPDCASWSIRRITADPAHPEGVTDRYVVDLIAGRAADPRRVFGDAVDRLFRYDIFPPTLMRARICTADRRIAPEAIVIQRVRLGLPVIESAVKVVDAWGFGADDAQDAGFVYATLEGHPERGISRFQLIREGSTVKFEIQATSMPGTLLTSIGRPISRRFQRAATRAALRYFASG